MRMPVDQFIAENGKKFFNTEICPQSPVPEYREEEVDDPEEIAET